MGEQNKILDVTYGSFSCRLEGFDDAVATMKSVVGYFHELAGPELFAEGAPVVPDADAIARLAATQIAGQVAVESDGNGVSLRVITQEDEAEAKDPVDEAPLVDESDEITAEAPLDMAGEAETSDQDMEDDGLETEAVAEMSFDEMPAIAEPETDVTEDGDQSVADKLERIRAVVGRGTAPQTSTESYAEDLGDDEETPAPKAVNPLAQRLAELAKRNSELMDADARAAVPLKVEDNDDDIADDVAAADDEADEPVKAAAEITEEVVAFAAQEDDIAPEEEMPAAEDEVRMQPAGDEGKYHNTDLRSLADEDNAIAEDENDLASENKEDVASEGEHIDEPDDSPDDSRKDAAPLTLMAEERVDTDKEDDADADESDDDTPSARADSPMLLTGRLQPIRQADDEEEDNFNLQDEIAKIERDLSARPGNELARHGLPRSVEDAMSRILEQTDLKLDLQETRDGRDAFAQLKAAVAATEAARQLGDAGAKSRDVSAQFRDDFGALEGTGNADGSAMPPLKLVEPINDVPPTRKSDRQNIAASRLRQIAEMTKANTGETPAMDFPAFAQSQGAYDLADKLEAAAAYLCFVQDARDFSRPQVMKVVQSASDTDISREDGLRAFGRLLRQARLVKLANGRFQVAENTRFRPETGKAAQG